MPNLLDRCAVCQAVLPYTTNLKTKLHSSKEFPGPFTIHIFVPFNATIWKSEFVSLALYSTSLLGYGW